LGKRDELYVNYKKAYDFDRSQQDAYLKDNFQNDIGKYLSTHYKNHNILDLGCGPGNYSKCFNPGKYLGVDFSRDLIEAAKRKNPMHNFQTQDIIERNYFDFSTDYVLLMSTLEHLPNFKKVLQVLDQSLEIANIGVIVVWHSPPRLSQFWPAIRVVQGTFGKSIYQNHYPFWIFFLKFRFTRIKFPIHELWILKRKM